MSSQSTQRVSSPLTAPGPSPWYLRVPEAATLQTSRGLWRWRSPREAALASLSCLVAPNRATTVLLEVGCYVLPLPGDRILVWYERTRSSGDSIVRPGVVFTLLHLNELQPLDRKAAAAAMSSAQRPMAFEGGRPVVFEIPTDLDEGVHTIAPPVAFADLPEVLVLADYGPEKGNHFDKMYRAIFACDFKAGQVAVLPQRWFNEGSYDFGYQWITRVQREAATGQIFGEGIRLGYFRLDASGTRIEAWLDDELRPLERQP